MTPRSRSTRYALPRLLVIGVVLGLAVSCDEDSQTTGPSSGDDTIAVTDPFPHLTFIQPVDLQHAADGTSRLFVVEQAGVLHVFNNSPQTRATDVFLDIQGRVDSRDIEQGLLSLAFDPQFASNGYFYVYYTSTEGKSARISRFTVTPPGGNSADPSSEEIILSVEQPGRGHNGGQLAFDRAGYLYFSFGDGIGPGDPVGNGQNRTTILGSIIRIDVRTLPYTIPPDNPYDPGPKGFREEIYAHGFRNPWRMTIDIPSGQIWVGDVGQGKYEEIDKVKRGLNYGWDCREGSHEYDLDDDPGAPSPLCSGITEFEDPVVEYPRVDGTTVIGGYVYRGSRMLWLFGKYVFTDYESGTLWCLDTDAQNPMMTTLIDSTGLTVSSFGMDRAGELYLLNYSWRGDPTKIYKLTGAP